MENAAGERRANMPDVLREPSGSQAELQNALYQRPLRIKRLAVTTTRCPHCLHLNPHYQEREDFDGEMVLSSVRRILSVADCVESAVVMGSEGMLHPQLATIIAALNDEPRLLEVCLTTNGCHLPQPALMEVLKLPRSRVFVSNYDSVIASKSPECIRLLAENAIRYDVALSDKHWVDAGGG
ncbi:MAG: hypothetical protein LBD93_08340 [Treponema sp.]|jgi:hypothetical protein|nr:hypothetical protein [Treponema sp.]